MIYATNAIDLKISSTQFKAVDIAADCFNRIFIFFSISALVAMVAKVGVLVRHRPKPVKMLQYNITVSYSP